MKSKNHKEESAVLVVDDETSILTTIRRTLEMEGMTVVTAKSGEEAFSILETSIFDAIICDYGLPDIDGIELIIEARKTNPDIGSALITGYGADNMIIEAFTKGGVDCYLSKPFSAKEVVNIALLAIKEGAIRKREREFKSELTKKVEEATRELTIANRLLEKKESETARLNEELCKDRERLSSLNERLRKLSITDDMTGLYNHRHFRERLAAELDRVKRYGGELSVLILDIDNFKQVNDQYGHLTGDDVLKEIGAELLSSSRRIDLPARYGGEEFIVILPSVAGDGAALNGERLRKAVEGLIVQTEKGPISVTVSVGVASFDGSSRLTSQRLVREADEALYHAKSIGKNCVVVFQKTGFNTFGKGSFITETQKDSIIDDTLNFARAGNNYLDILRYFSEKIQSTLKNEKLPVFVAVYEKAKKGKVAEILSIGGKWKAPDRPEDVALLIFKKGRHFTKESSSGSYAAFPIKIRREGQSRRNETIAAIIINRAPANSDFINEMVESVSISIETSLVIQKVSEERDRARLFMEIADASRKIRGGISRPKGDKPENLGAILSRASTLLSEISIVRKTVALLVEEKNLVPASGRGKVKKPLVIESAQSAGLVKKALGKAGRRRGAMVAKSDSDLSPFERDIFGQYRLSLPVAAIAVSGKDGSSGLLLLDLDYIDNKLIEHVESIGLDLNEAILHANVALIAEK